MTAITNESAPKRLGITGRGFGLKLLLVCALALVMALPALFVFGVLQDRQNRARTVTAEIGAVRGGEQTFLGPVLVAPYLEETVFENDDGERTVRRARKYYLLYAETGSVEARATTETLRRSIYNVPVYEAELTFAASFDLAAARAAAAGLNVEWGSAALVVGVSSLKGARRAETSINGAAARALEPFTPDMITREIAPAALGRAAPLPNLNTWLELAATPVDASAGARLEAAADLAFSGATRIAFPAFAKDTRASLSGDWPHPSFDGAFLPAEREISETGFSATWEVPFLARGVPGAGPISSIGLPTPDDGFGVRLVNLTDVYSSVGRALKYALMFIGFVFLAYFLFEVTSGKRAHAAQYVLVGLVQATFYLLLLAFAEQIGFDWAFLIAAGATVGATGLYAAPVFGGWTQAGRAVAVFTGVYSLMYVLMRLEDYALLVGACASFAVLAGTMFITRRIDWYGGEPADT